jgi:acyl-coenzyme A synthetase/AMP-(fatty) acid ligase/acyl carrier protein
MSVTPPVMRQMLAEHLWADCVSLQWVFCVGEALESAVADAFAAQSNAVLCNSYAQTEACPAAVAPTNSLLALQPIPVGRTAANTTLYVLDAHLQLAPIGVAGEIFVGGPSVTRGYFDNSALTAEKYVPDPFGRAGARLYRTGDVGRWDEEGRLTFLGRRDERLKIMGYRVDPREIEQALMDIDGVAEAAVIADREASVGAALISFVRLCMPVPADARQRLGPRELLGALQRRLPHYMLPNRICVVDEFPRGRTNKTDRLELLRLARIASAAPVDEDVPPSSALEREIAATWEEVLGLPADSVGLYTSFFELGGQSLLAAKIVRRLRTRFRVELDVRHLFEAATVAGLADIVETMSNTSDSHH